MNLMQEEYCAVNQKPKRECKGKSLLRVPGEMYTVIDIETTGLDPRYDEIIEVAAVRVLNGKVVDTFSLLCKPTASISDFITQLTGITNEMLLSAPPLVDVLVQFLEFIEGTMLVGHNVNFDINFLYDRCLEELGVLLENDFVDTLRLARRVAPQCVSFKLQDLVSAFNISVQPAHRALADCLATLQCYEYLICHADEIGTDLVMPRRRNPHVSAKDIVACHTCFDEEHVLFGKVCVFTGSLTQWTRAEAMQHVADLGGICANSVTKKTQFLVVGDFDYASGVKGDKSSKLKKAEEYILKGIDLKILTEQVFRDMLEDSDR